MLTSGLILLVEDNANDEALFFRALVKNQLAPRVEVTRDGAEAIDFLLAKGTHHKRDPSELPAVVFLDLNLPKIDGLGVLRAIRADVQLTDVPVVMLTTSADDADRRACYTAGCNSYVQKPVAFKDFCEVVRLLVSYWLHTNQGAPPG